jgi:GNAT superfamily N-acetyltransferase
VRPALSRADRRRFIRFPHDLYADDPNYRAPLDLMIREQISAKTNPWFEHGEAEFYLAYRGDRLVGRISAQVDRMHLKRYEDDTGFFGFFEVADDAEAAAALLKTAADWCRARGMKRMLGPFSLSINEESGLLVEGFDSPNYMMMPHGRPYYDGLIKAAGLEKAVDLFAWRYSRSELPEHAFELAEMAREHPGVTIRNVDMKNLARDVRIIMDIYNEAWADNWGFVPMTEAELDKMAKDFKLIVDPEMCMIAEVDGKPAAMTVALPNINEAFAGLNGRLAPLGWAKVLYRLKIKHPTSFRCLLLGVREEFRSIAFGGLSVLLYTTIYQRAYDKGYVEAEAGWTLENNRAINQGMKLMGAEQYKTYRMYEQEI